jgi:hypothetical protein
MGFLVGLVAVLIALGALLFASARKIPATAAATVPLACAASVFLVRLYPVARGFDLGAALANVLVGALLLWLGLSLRRSSRVLPLFRAVLLVVPFALFSGLIATLHEVGEVVVLRTTDDRGSVHETRFWVLDYEGSTWIGSGMENAGYRRLVANPRAELLRRGEARCVTGVPIEYSETSEVVFRRLREKYLMARLMSVMGYKMFFHNGDPPESEVVAVRLDACSTPGP